jgi:hypothetical protein
MWYAIEAVVCILLGGWGGYALGQKVKNKGEAAYMTGLGYVKSGENWVKSRL